MRQVFDSREFEEAEHGRETELTLGATGLLAICFGLILLCGLFFGLGYAAGHRSPAELAQSLEKAPAAGSPPVASGSVPKPSPTPAPAAAGSASDTTQAQATTDPDGDVVSTPALNPPAYPGSAVQPAGSAPANPSAVRPALAPQTVQPSATTVPGAPVGPAMHYMVQIAAVSHAEDASVLTNALLRRGYAVTARRDPTDSLIHVQVGPFGDLNAANAMRLKLLNDGYNAIVEP
jgi:DedD protein